MHQNIFVLRIVKKNVNKQKYILKHFVLVAQEKISKSKFI